MRRRGLLLAALCTLAASLVVPVVEAAPSRVRGWTLTRTGPGAAELDAELWAMAASDNAAIVMFALRGSGAKRDLDGRFGTTVALVGMDLWPKVYGHPVATPDCPGVCPIQAGTPSHLYVHSNERAISSTVYVAAWDVADARFTFNAPGWKVTPWRASMRVRTVDEAAGAQGVSVGGTSTGTYHGGEIDGGRYGSFVHAALPCAEDGEGEAVLSAPGLGSWPLSCPDDHAMSLHTARRVRYKVTGWSRGRSYSPIVFAVVDWPKG